MNFQVQAYIKLLEVFQALQNACIQQMKKNGEELYVDFNSEEKVTVNDTYDNKVPHINWILRTAVMIGVAPTQAHGRRGTTEILHANMPYRGPASGVADLKR